jgi:hypothetical protein
MVDLVVDPVVDLAEVIYRGAYNTMNTVALPQRSIRAPERYFP